MGLLPDFVTLTGYIKYLAEAYPPIQRIHYFCGQQREIPLLVCELDRDAETRIEDFGRERWICENFLDLYLLKPGQGWLSKCQHLSEGLVLSPTRVRNLSYNLAFERQFGFFPLALGRPAGIDFALTS